MMKESLRFDPNTCTASDARGKMLKPSCILCFISPRIDPTISGVHAKTWDPFEMAVSSDRHDHTSPVWTGMPSYT